MTSEAVSPPCAGCPEAEAMTELQAIARLKIHHGKVEEFKRLAVKCMESVRPRDSGTLQYDWFFSDYHSKCVVHERYRDSAALLEHGANLEIRWPHCFTHARSRARSAGRPARS